MFFVDAMVSVYRAFGGHKKTHYRITSLGSFSLHSNIVFSL